MLRLATIAESKVRAVEKVIQSSIGQTLLANGVAINASVAEKTLANYAAPGGGKGGDPTGGRRSHKLADGQTCFGCGGDHSWRICPHRDKPDYQARATANWKVFA